MTDHKITQIEKGSPLLPGTNRIGNGFQFAIEAPEDAEVSLLFYYKKSKEPVQEIVLGKDFADGRIRSAYLPGFRPKNYEYNYKINGTVTLDPYAYLLYGKAPFGVLAEDTGEHQIRCGFLKEDFPWGDEKAPRIAYENLVLYKLHVRGYTKQYPISPKKRGTFSGLMQMIPYFKELGINGVELMPAYEFEEMPVKEKSDGMVIAKKQTDRINYWGYQKGYYEAPKSAYCATEDPEKEFKTLIKALHEAGIECIMEFYFPADVNPLVVLRVAQFWHLQYHVDGFHMTGEGVPKNLLLADPVLSDVKLLCDGFPSWDIRPGRGRYLAEYNEGFLQEMRRFLKSDEEMVEPVMRRIRRNPPEQATINYLACQNGFTLFDMVSYNYKHNEENGEENHDGQNYNFSWNCGAEGPVRKQSVLRLRERQLKNAILLLMLSQGTPMLYGGDEFGNSQGGNNNAYCQDNPIGWTDWKAFRKHQRLFHFVKQAIAFRQEHPILHTGKELSGVDQKALGFPDISFHGEKAWFVNKENTSRLLGILYNGAYAKKADGTPDDDFYIACNFHWEDRSIAIPNLPGEKHWYKILDTNTEKEEWSDSRSPEISERTMKLAPRSIVILIGKQRREEGASLETL